GEYVYNAQRAGLPVDAITPSDGTAVQFVTLNVVANRPNQDLAKKFVDFSLSVAAQKGFADEMFYSPTIRGVEVSEEAQPVIIDGDADADKIRIFDAAMVQERRPEWVDLWNRAVAE